jgi:hypothetical protein
MIDWPIAFSTLSQAFKVAQELRAVDKELSVADMKLKVADLTSSLADIKLTLTEAKSEASVKDEEITRLKKLHRTVAEDTVEVNGYRFRKATNREGAAGNPYCPVCFAKQGLLIELTDTILSGRPLRCPSCSALYSNVPSFTD